MIPVRAVVPSCKARMGKAPPSAGSSTRRSRRWATAMGKRRPSTGSHPLSVDGDQGRAQRARIDGEIRAGRAIDEAQPDAPALVDGEDLGIFQGSAIGEEGVVVDVVQIGLHAAHAPPPISMPDMSFPMSARPCPSRSCSSRPCSCRPCRAAHVHAAHVHRRPCREAPALFVRSARISSGLRKLKSCSRTTTSCRSRSASAGSWMISGAAASCCSCSP